MSKLCAHGWVKMWWANIKQTIAHRYHPFTFCSLFGHVRQVLPMHSEECLNCTCPSLSFAVPCCASGLQLQSFSVNPSQIEILVTIKARQWQYWTWCRLPNIIEHLTSSHLQAISPCHILPLERGLVGRSPRGIQRSRRHSAERCPRWHVCWSLVEHQRPATKRLLRSGDATSLVAAWLHKCNATGLADEPVTNACSAVLPYMESDGDKLQQKRVKDFAISWSITGSNSPGPSAMKGHQTHSNYFEPLLVSFGCLAFHEASYSCSAPWNQCSEVRHGLQNLADVQGVIRRHRGLTTFPADGQWMCALCVWSWTTIEMIWCLDISPHIWRLT